MEEPPPDFVPLYGSRSKQRCVEYELVLLAVGIRCAVLPGDGRFALAVDARDLERAREQLRLYGQEHRAWPPRLDARLRVTDGLACACLYGMTILLADMLQADRAFGLDWWGAGLSHAGLIREGEWWRAVTALTLHADALHLIGNLVFGLAFGFFAGGMLGWGLAWSGMLLAGALGNALNAFVQAPVHTSVGASTAVFAAVGILAAWNWRQRRRGARIGSWASLGAGVALLAFLGMQGERTDILAHVAGLGAGSLFGLAFALLEARAPLAPWHKHALGVAASLLLALAWTEGLVARG